MNLRVCEHPKKTIIVAAFALLFAVASLVALAPAENAWASETKSVSGNYAVLEGTTLTFKYSAGETSVTADAIYTGYDTATYDGYQNRTPWFSYNSGITKVVFDKSVRGNLKPVSTAYWFYYMHKLEGIEDLGNLDTSKATSMRGMFDGCTSLASLDVSGFDTSSVTDMGFMFEDCSSLKVLDVSRFDTSKVTSMRSMFYRCPSLTSLDVSGFDTSQVTNMNLMFYHCSTLTSLDVSGFDTSQATDTSWMFHSCSSLTSLDVSGFDTSKVTDMGEMFSGCSSLTSLDVSGFDVSSVDEKSALGPTGAYDDEAPLMAAGGKDLFGISGLFMNCSSLKTIYGSGSWSDATSSSGDKMFSGCTSLVGGNGTAYSSDHVDVEYARVDEVGSPGYFSAPETPMHRLYNPNSGEHFYTSDDAERSFLASIGWHDEGVGWTAPPASATPVYRMYNPVAGEHHYTPDADERQMLIEAGWNDEGVGWYSDDAETVPLYRDYNPNQFANNHNYTADVSEHENLVSLGWRDEGIAWYGM